MSFDKVTHELHQRRKSRNVGLGLTLAAFVVIILGLTYVKITSGAFEVPRGEVQGS